VNKTITTLAGAAALLAATVAQAQSVSAYGLIDMSAGRFQNVDGEKIWKAENGAMTTSFLGFRGSEDLGGGLKAKFAIEHFFRADSGSAGRFDGDAFWARSAWVGLEGAFGSTTFGRNTTPMFVSTLIFNPFGDSFGFSPSIRQYYLGALLGDSGWSNSVRYISPNLSGATVNLMVNAGEGAGTGRNHSASVLYFGGPLAATAAWQSVKNGFFGGPAGFEKQNALQLGVSYDLGMAKLFGQYGDVSSSATVDVDTTIVQVGATVKAGLGAVLASYGQAKTEVGAAESTRKTFSLGYDYLLSKNTDVYAAFMNEKVTGLDSATTFAVGIRLKF
jgi:predicted porin